MVDSAWDGFLHTTASWEMMAFMCMCVVWYMVRCGALVCLCVCGCLCGGALPIVFKRLGLDPAMMSNPFVAGIIDIVGIVIYMNVAIWFLGETPAS